MIETDGADGGDPWVRYGILCRIDGWNGRNPALGMDLI